MSEELFKEKVTELKKVLEKFGLVKSSTSSSTQEDITPHRFYHLKLDDVEVTVCISCENFEAEPPYSVTATLEKNSLYNIMDNEMLGTLHSALEKLASRKSEFYKYTPKISARI